VPKTEHDHHNLGGSNKLLTLAEAAAILNVPPTRLRDHWKRWGIPALRIGRELRFRERDLDNWISKRIAA
jgi:excisionase family DNA binding protein